MGEEMPPVQVHSKEAHHKYFEEAGEQIWIIQL